MTLPDPETLSSLALAYAAGEADAAERRVVERLLAAGDPAAAAAVAEGRAVVAALAAAASTPVAPDAGQWERLASRLTSSRPAAPAAAPPVVLKMPKRSIWPPVLAAAAAAALIGGGLSYLVATRGDATRQREFADVRQTAERQKNLLDAAGSTALQREAEADDRRAEIERLRGRLSEQTALAAAQQSQLNDQQARLTAVSGELDARAARLTEQQRQVAELSDRLERAQRQLDFVTAPGVIVARVSGTPAMPGIEGNAFVGADVPRRVQLSVSKLTPPAAGKTYQFWVIPEGDGKAPVSIGVFAVGADGAAKIDLPLPATPTPPKVLAISLEPAGGTASPTGPIVATGPVGG